MSETTLPECPTKDRLTEEYVAARVRYVRTTERLRAQRGVLPQEAYEQLRALGESTRQQSEESRAELERHVREHGC